MNAEVAPLASQRKRRARWAIAIVVVIAIAAIAAVVPVILKSTKDTTSVPSTVPAEARTITQVVSGSGSTVAAESVTVNPEVSGTITKLYVSLGETVTAGDELYVVSSEDAESALLQAETKLLQAEQSKIQAATQLDQAEAQLYSAKTKQIQAEQTLDSLESQPATSTAAKGKIRIAKREVTSAKQAVSSAGDSVDSAEVGVEVATSDYKAAKRSYDDAAEDIDQTVVTAPSDGTITSLPVSKGDYVSAGTSSSSSAGASSASGGSTSGTSSGSTSSSSSSGSSIVIADLTDLAVAATISEVDVADLAVGMEATVTIDAISGETLDGTVRSISPNAASSSGVVTYEVEIALEHVDERLRPGMTATTDIVTQTVEDAVAVPNSAVRSDGAEKYVQVLTDGTRTEKRAVEVGATDDTYTEVTNGLNVGEQVLTASATSTTNADDGELKRGGMMMGGPPAGAGPGGQ